jgi:hypothetical protein
MKRRRGHGDSGEDGDLGLGIWDMGRMKSVEGKKRKMPRRGR